MNKEIIVYTTEKDLRKLNPGVKVFSTDLLGEKKAGWVNKTAESMSTEQSSKLEEEFLDKIKGFVYYISRQPYFRINNHGYFLDFFVPALNLAIEIDGWGNHYAWRKEIYDWKRDEAFLSIGIKTVRFTAVEIRKVDFRDAIFSPRVRDIISGKLSIDDNYYKPKCERFKGKESINRTLVRGAIEIIEQCNDRDRIIIESDHTYILKVLDHGHDARENAANKDLLDDYYTKRNQKHIGVGLRYCGNRENMGNGWIGWVCQLDHFCEKQFQDAKVYRLSCQKLGEKACIEVLS